MRQPHHVRAHLAALVGALVLVSAAEAQQLVHKTTLSDVAVPGGVRAAAAALGDRTTDRAQFLVDVIRRSYQTPVAIKGLRRDAILHPVLEHLDRWQKSGTAGVPVASGQDAAADVVPLPLTPAIWTGVILAGHATEQTLVAELLRSSGASLTYCALLALDDRTRDWFAAQPQLLGEIAARYPAAFMLAAPALRIDGDAIRVPGGEAAVPGWQAIVGRPVTEPAEFVRGLLSQKDGRLAYLFGALSQLTLPQTRFLLNLDAAEPARIATLRRTVTVIERVALGWDIDERPFWRPALDPMLLVSDLTADDKGRPSIPGTTAFWTAVLEGAGTDRVNAEADAALTRDLPVDVTWLCEQIFTGGQAVHRGPYQLVLFASRRIKSITASNVRDALVSLRAAALYPALVGTLERARIASLTTYANAALRAAKLSRIDADPAVRAMTLFQGALALVTRASARGSLTPAQTSALINSLIAIEPGDRGEYSGRIVEWLRQATFQASVAEGTATSGTEPAVVNGGADHPDSLDRRVLRLLAGPAPGKPLLLDWEGTKYRIDFATAEAVRLRRLLGDEPRPYLAAADAMVAAADVVSLPAPTRAQVALQAESIRDVVVAVGCDSAAVWEDNGVRTRCRDTAAALDRAARTGDAREGARLAPRLRLLADDLAARGLLELAYAVALGQPDGSAITAPDAASRHDFALDLPGFGRNGAWRRPAAGADRLRDWHVTGSLLALDVTLAQFTLTRLSDRPPSARPTFNDEDRRVLVEAIPLIEPSQLTDGDHRAIVDAMTAGRARLAAIHSGPDIDGVADSIRLPPMQRTLLAWTLAHDPDRLATAFGPVDAFLLGMPDGPAPARLNAWGVPGEPRLGCLCLQLTDRRPSDMLTGRWYSGIMATGFADLNLRLAELLAEMKMPASLLAGVLAGATWDFVINVQPRDLDDRASLVEYVKSLGIDRVEQYLALLTTDGPLVPLLDGSDPR